MLRCYLRPVKQHHVLLPEISRLGKVMYFSVFLVAKELIQALHGDASGKKGMALAWLWQVFATEGGASVKPWHFIRCFFRGTSFHPFPF